MTTKNTYNNKDNSNWTTISNSKNNSLSDIIHYR